MGNAPSTQLTLSYYSDELKKKPINPNQSDFWDMLWSTPQNNNEIYAFFSPATLSAIHTSQPANIISLIRVLLAQLYGNINAVRPLSYIPTVKAPQRLRSADINKLNHCVTILTRVLVWLAELNASDPEAATKILWNANVVESNETIVDIRYAIIQTEYVDRVNTNIAHINSINKSEAAAAQANRQSIDATHNVVIASEADTVDATSMQSTPPAPTKHSSAMLGNTIGANVVALLYELLFLETYTIDVQNRKQQLYQGVFIHRQYETSVVPVGAYYPSNTVGWSYLDVNRIAVLKCMLVACSAGIYIEPTEYKHHENDFLQTITADTQVLAPTLFYSLVSTILSYNPNNQYLPYTQNMYTSYENREKLVDLSLQLLLVLLDFRNLDSIGTNATIDPSMSNVPTPTPPIPPAIPQDLQQRGVSLHSNSNGSKPNAVHYDNIFRRLMFTMSDNKVLIHIYRQLTNLMNNYLYADNTYMSNSQKKVDCFQEVTCLLWKLVDEHPTFTSLLLYGPQAADVTSSHVVSAPPVPSKDKEESLSVDVLELIHPLLYVLHKCRADVAKQGLMYTCVFILLKLSGEREFGVALNTGLNTLVGKNGAVIPKLPYAYMLSKGDTMSNGTYGDLLVIVCTQLIVQSPTHLDALLKVVLTMLCNVSPYLTSLQLVSATKMLELFELFNTNSFLAVSETNHQYISLLIDIYNNIIQYQYQGHTNLVYCIIRRAKLFWSLSPNRQQQTSENTATSSTASAFVANSPASSVDTSVSAAPEPSNNTNTEVDGDDWRSQLPLEPIYRLLEFFVPKIDKLFKDNPKLDESGVLNLIKKTTLVGVLPKPHSLLVRRYIPNAYTAQWFTTYTWGVLFVRNSTPLPLWNGDKIKMFTVTLPPANTTQPPTPDQSVPASLTGTPAESAATTPRQVSHPTGVQLAKQLRGLNGSSSEAAPPQQSVDITAPVQRSISTMSTSSIYQLSDTTTNSELPSASAIDERRAVMTQPPSGAASEQSMRDAESIEQEPRKAAGGLADVTDDHGTVSLQ